MHYFDVRDQIDNGDVLLFRGSLLHSRIIQRWTRSVYSHVGLALWIRTDEGEDVVLQFSGHRFGLAPRTFYQFGERVGQGQRFAYLRVTRFAELHLSITSQVLVSPGQSVVAGIDLLGKLPHP